MRRLDTEYGFDTSHLDRFIEEVEFETEEGADRDALREMVATSGTKLETIEFKPRELKLLACDCSSAVKELKFHCLWATHSVAVYAEYDRGRHPDNIVGHSSIGYKNLFYGNSYELGLIREYDNVDVRGSGVRMEKEFKTLNKSHQELCDTGLKPDIVMLDGSLSTFEGILEKNASTCDEVKKAGAEYEKLAGKNLCSMVEDSHSREVTKGLGLNMTDLMYFDIVLDEGEIGWFGSGENTVAFIKLPAKPLPFEGGEVSRPLTVRWEFKTNDFRETASVLGGIWISEEDMFHPQIYPLRLSDYLSRKIKPNGIIEEAVDKMGLETRHRENRQW